MSPISRRLLQGATHIPGRVANDWRSKVDFIPISGTIAFGFTPVVGTRAAFESQWGAVTNIVRIYDQGKIAGTENSLLAITGGSQDALNAGLVPVLDHNLSQMLGNAGFNMIDMNGTGMSCWAWVAAGNYNADGVGPTGRPYQGLDSWADAIKALSSGTCPTNRIMFTLCHEFESITEGGGDGTNRAGSPAEFATMYRYVWNRFKTRGAANIRWGMNFAGATTNLGTSLNDSGSDGYYPGHLYVDWLGWDPYNAAGIRDNTWRSFENINNKFGELDWWHTNFSVGGNATGTGIIYKPVMICEFGTVDSYTDAQSASYNALTWFDDMITYLSTAGNADIFRWLLYYNDANMNLLSAGSYRMQGSTNRGKATVWAKIN